MPLNFSATLLYIGYRSEFSDDSTSSLPAQPRQPDAENDKTDDDGQNCDAG